MPIPTIMSAPSPAHFNPMSVPDAMGWWAADRSIVGVADGADFTTVTDLSGAGNTGTSGGSPTYHLDAQNGRPAMRFVAASTQYVAIDGIAEDLDGADTPFTVFAAAKCTSTAANRNLFSIGNSADATQYHRLFVKSTNAVASDRRSASDGPTEVTGGIPGTSAHVFSQVFPGTTVSAWMDGAAIYTAQALDLASITCDRAAIAAFARAAYAATWEGDIYEVILYSRALAPSERVAVERYLGWKWGIAA